MSIESSRSHGERERGRLQAPGRRIDHGGHCTLLIVNEVDDSEQ